MNTITFAFTSVKKNGTIINKDIPVPTGNPFIPADVADTVEQNGFCPISERAVIMLCRIRPNKGCPPTPQELADKPALTDLLGVNLTRSPYAVVKLPDTDTGYAIVKGNDPNIKSGTRNTGTRHVKDKHLYVVRDIIASNEKRYCRPSKSAADAVLTHYVMTAKKSVRKDNLPLVYDFTGVPIDGERGNDWDMIKTILTGIHGVSADRLSAENITYKPA